MTIYLHKSDIPSDIDWGNIIAVDTETTGLHLYRDRLCVVQISSGDGNAHLVQFQEANYDAPNLQQLLVNDQICKLFHYARFDMAILYKSFATMTKNIFCTKIASKLVRTNTSRHGLKDLCRDLINIVLEKDQTSSDWASDTLTAAQQQYAANDVLYLHQLHEKLQHLLDREKRDALAQSCFSHLALRVMLDLSGFENDDIFAH